MNIYIYNDENIADILMRNSLLHYTNLAFTNYFGLELQLQKYFVSKNVRGCKKKLSYFTLMKTQIIKLITNAIKNIEVYLKYQSSRLLHNIFLASPTA